MKANNFANLNKKTVFVYKATKSANSFKTDPTKDATISTAKTSYSSIEIMFQK